MLYDLNIVWTPQTTQADLERTLRFSQSLGYNIVALNQILKGPIQAQITSPIPQIGPVHPSFPQPPNQTSSSSPAAAAPAATNTRLPTVIPRATVLVSDPATNHRLPLLSTVYPLLAARPTTEKAFAALTTGTSYPEVALISLDLSLPQLFRFRPKPCMAAVARGVLFEVCYGQLLGGDARARASFIANVMELVRATKGRGIVVSSECWAAGGGGGDLRAPADLVNLFACWGLGPERGLEALDGNPRAVVVNEGLKRRSFRGVVDIVEVEGRVPGQEKGTEGDEGPGKKQKNKGDKKQAGQQNPKQAGNGKRKHDGGTEHGGGEQGLPVMSKRQAKKMKLAEQKAASTTEASK